VGGVVDVAPSDIDRAPTSLMARPKGLPARSQQGAPPVRKINVQIRRVGWCSAEISTIHGIGQRSRIRLMTVIDGNSGRVIDDPH